MTARATDLLYRLRFVLSSLAIAGAVAFLPAVNITAVDNDIQAWFANDSPAVRDYDRFRAEFGGTQPLLIALESVAPEPGAPPASGMFTRDRLRAVQSIGAALQLVPTVRHVQSLATTSIVRAAPSEAGADDEGLDVGPLLDDLDRRSPRELLALAAADPLLQGDLVSRDGTIVGLIVTFDEEALDRNQRAIVDRVHDTIAASLPAGVAAHFNGTIEVRDTYDRVTVENNRQFVPAILTLTIAAVLVLFRSVTRAAVVLISILVSVLWTLGLYDLMGFGFNILTAMLVPLVVVLAISDDVHIIQGYDEARRHGPAERAFKDTVGYLWRPLCAASGTTALGLLSLATSDIVAVRHFGIGAAIGVLLDLAISLVLVPTLLGFCRPVPERRSSTRVASVLRRASLAAMAHPRAVALATASMLAAAVPGILRLQVDTNHMNFFAASHPLGRSATVIDERLAGVYGFHMLIEGPPDSLQRADTLARIDTIAAQLRALPDVRKVVSLADYVKRANQALNGERADMAVIPASDEAAAQEVLLLSLTDEGRHELARVVSHDYSKSQMTVRLPAMNSDRVFDLIETANGLARNAFNGTPVSAAAAGSGRLFIELDHYLVSSQLSSFTTAFFTVFVTLFVIFRSFRYGLVALVPNVLPVLAVLGAMGWLGISLNVATVMVASVALGIVDDDTVHYLTRFRHELARGASLDAAIGTTAAVESRAALTSAVITSCGFGVLLLSAYKPAAWFGGLLAATLFVAFAAELFVLPAVLSCSRRLLRL